MSGQIVGAGAMAHTLALWYHGVNIIVLSLPAAVPWAQRKDVFSMKRKTWLFTVLLAAGCLLPTAAMAESTDVMVFANNHELVPYEEKGIPYISDAGRTMVPLRQVGELMDYTTDWTSDGRIHISGKDGAVDVTLQAGSTAYTANGEAGQFETAPVIRDGRTFLPARDFGELYGSVYWDGPLRTVWISDREGPSYAFSNPHMIRYEGDRAEIVTMPEGYEVNNDDVPEFVVNQKAFDGYQYMIVVYNRDSLANAEFFRDDGDHMTHLASLNATTDFTIDGDLLYFTSGVSAGHAGTGVLDPYALYVSDMSDEGKGGIYHLDFAVNACTLAVEEGKLVATSPDGTRHVVDLSTLTPEKWPVEVVPDI